MEKIEKIINDMSGSYSPQQIFSDWIEMIALATVNASSLFHDKVWKERESRYLSLAKKWEKDVQSFAYMNSILVVMLEDEIKDHLGEIYMNLGGSKQTGQFFTPWHLSKAVAALGKCDGDKVIMNEPSCGSGGMIIAMAEKLHREGKDYQQMMNVTAEDLDLRCCHMCYVQLSLLDINAVVIHHDALAEGLPRMLDVFGTPRRRGVFT